LVTPAVVAALLAAVAFWRKWAWLYPIAAAVAFVTGYVALNLPSDLAAKQSVSTVSAVVPKFPPGDGTDWLFWLAVPVAALAVIDTFLPARFGWLCAAAASGGVAFTVLRPLHDLPPTTLEFATLAFSGIGALLAIAIDQAARRSNAFWTTAALAIVAGGAGVVIFASHSRSVGLRGLVLAAALGPIAVLSFRPAKPRAAATFAAPLLIGLLVSGRFYADVTVANFWLLLATPLLVLIGAALPTQRSWLRGLAALLAVAIATAAVTAPVALTAKRAAESAEPDPYSAYR
jgi:hypothetical protein